VPSAKPLTDPKKVKPSASEAVPDTALEIVTVVEFAVALILVVSGVMVIVVAII
jgi:hypothetical protein